jgi:hypothetical protein
MAENRMGKRRIEDDKLKTVVHRRKRLSITCEASKESISNENQPIMAKDSLWIESLGVLHVLILPEL